MSIFTSSIEQRVFRDLFGPVWHEPPTALVELVGAVCLMHEQHILGGGDVVSGGDVPASVSTLEAQHGVNIPPWAFEYETSAHTVILITPAKLLDSVGRNLTEGEIANLCGLYTGDLTAFVIMLRRVNQSGANATQTGLLSFTGKNKPRQGWRGVW